MHTLELKKKQSKGETISPKYIQNKNIIKKFNGNLEVIEVLGSCWHLSLKAPQSHHIKSAENKNLDMYKVKVVQTSPKNRLECVKKKLPLASRPHFIPQICNFASDEVEVDGINWCTSKTLVKCSEQLDSEEFTQQNGYNSNTSETESNTINKIFDEYPEFDELEEKCNVSDFDDAATQIFEFDCLDRKDGALVDCGNREVVRDIIQNDLPYISYDVALRKLISLPSVDTVADHQEYILKLNRLVGNLKILTKKYETIWRLFVCKRNLLINGISDLSKFVDSDVSKNTKGSDSHVNCTTENPVIEQECSMTQFQTSLNSRSCTNKSSQRLCSSPLPQNVPSSQVSITSQNSEPIPIDSSIISSMPDLSLGLKSTFDSVDSTRPMPILSPCEPVSDDLPCVNDISNASVNTSQLQANLKSNSALSEHLVSNLSPIEKNSLSLICDSMNSQENSKHELERNGYSSNSVEDLHSENSNLNRATESVFVNKTSTKKHSTPNSDHRIPLVILEPLHPNLTSYSSSKENINSLDENIGACLNSTNLSNKCISDCSNNSLIVNFEGAHDQNQNETSLKKTGNKIKSGMSKLIQSKLLNNGINISSSSKLCQFLEYDPYVVVEQLNPNLIRRFSVSSDECKSSKFQFVTKRQKNKKIPLLNENGKRIMRTDQTGNMPKKLKTKHSCNSVKIVENIPGKENQNGLDDTSFLKNTVSRISVSEDSTSSKDFEDDPTILPKDQSIQTTERISLRDKLIHNIMDDVIAESVCSDLSETQYFTPLEGVLFPSSLESMETIPSDGLERVHAYFDSMLGS